MCLLIKCKQGKKILNYVYIGMLGKPRMNKTSCNTDDQDDNEKSLYRFYPM